MGFLKDLAGIAAPIVGGMVGGPVGSAIGGALGGALSSSGQPKSQTATTTQQLDPRADALLWGKGGQQGLLGQYQSMLGKPQDANLAQYGQNNLNYLGGGQAAMDQELLRASGRDLIGSSLGAPQSYAAQLGPAASAQAAQIQAPSQNSLDLKGSYNSLINGQAGNNPYLTGAIGKGINQSTAAFQNLQQDSTQNLLQSILPSIRGGAIASGQYGSSRQGLAEGSALSNFAKEQQRALSQFGQNNTDAAVSAQAGQYNADRDRQLAATQGLSSQQYGLASQNAQMQQQANMANAGAQNATNLANAGFQQQSGLANQQSQQNINALNTQRQGMGQAALAGLAGNAYNVGQNQDQYSLNNAGKVNNLLAPYLTAGGSQSTTSPLYSNPGASALGGAGAALGIYNQLAGAGGGQKTTGNLFDLFSTPSATSAIW